MVHHISESLSPHFVQLFLKFSFVHLLYLVVTGHKTLQLFILGMQEEGVRTAPDGGYGWVVCAVVFVICMIADAVINCYGVIMPEIIKTFHCSSSEAALIGAIQSGITYTLAIFIFALANKIGCRYHKKC